MKQVHHPGDCDPHSILVVLPTWVGDFVMATPTLRAIRDRFRDAHITFLTEPNLRDLVRGGDWMNDCVEWPAKDIRSPARKPFRDLAWDLRRRRFDWAVLLPNSFRAALIARIAGAKRRIGYDRDGRGFLLTDRLPVKNRRTRAKDKPQFAPLLDKEGLGEVIMPDRPPYVLPCKGGRQEDGQVLAQAVRPPFHPHVGVKMGANLPVPCPRFTPMPLVEYYADLAEAIGCERPGDKLELFTTPDGDEAVGDRLASLGVVDHHPLVVISPGARYGAAKCWMPDRFAAVCDRLIESQGAAVIITCGPGEEPIAREIGSAMKHEGFILADPGLTLGQMKSLVRRSDLLIGNDAGIRHFAKAFDVSLVTIFGPTHPDWTTTSYEAERIVRVDIECGPCQQRVCPLGHLDCMDRVTVDMVYAASEELLGSPARQLVR